MKLTSEIMNAVLSAEREQTGEKSVLEILCDHYAELHGVGNPVIKEIYESLRVQMKNLPAGDVDRILNEMNLLCSEYEYEAYTTGVKVGIRLMCELMA